MHPTAQAGFSTEAKAYTTGRPDYPDALRGWLAEPFGVNATATVIDLGAGAGTGKFTRLLNPAADIVAIEPVEYMRAEFALELPGIKVIEGMAEAIPLPEGTADVLVYAQAFH